MADQPKEQQPKQKMFTEQEHLERLTRAFDRARISVFTHEIKHGFQTHGDRMAPDVTIRILGGDLANVQALTLKIERLILEYAEQNPPVLLLVQPQEK